jgi:hypothetical protein
MANFLLPNSFLQDEYKTVATDYLVSYLSSKPTSLQNEFADAFVPIEESLKEKLSAHFPRHEFLIARTYYTHWVPREGMANILLVIDRLTGTVEGHQWAIGFGSSSESFLNFLKQYPAASKADALSKATTLAELIVTLSRNGNIGTVHSDKKGFQIELKRGDYIRIVLQAPLNKELQFGKLLFINPSESKRN